MLFLIGLGLGDEKDITVKGLEIVKKCKRVYLEHYTSILTCGKERLVRLFVSCCRLSVFEGFRVFPL
jgi:diphthine methyl ester synthase